MYSCEIEKSKLRIVSYQYRMLGWVSILALWETRSGHQYYCPVRPTNDQVPFAFSTLNCSRKAYQRCCKQSLITTSENTHYASEKCELQTW